MPIGFTIVELLVAISVISILMGILLPAFNMVRSHAKNLVAMHNQKQIADAVNLFAVDNDDKYPASVCVTGSDENWNWNDPRTLASWNTVPSHPHRSMGAYLNSYITKASTIACPKSPYEFKYLQQAWDAGDKWKNPDIPIDILSLRGSYCFYWNYIGWINNKKNFIGPKSPAGGRGQSKLLMSCYFGYDHRNTPDAYGSCESLQNARIVPESETYYDSPWWTTDLENVDSFKIKLNAAYTDGHVESFTPSQALPMKVISSTNKPYEKYLGPGDFYIPENALH